MARVGQATSLVAPRVAHGTAIYGAFYCPYASLLSAPQPLRISWHIEASWGQSLVASRTVTRRTRIVIGSSGTPT